MRRRGTISGEVCRSRQRLQVACSLLNASTCALLAAPLANAYLAEQSGAHILQPEAPHRGCPGLVRCFAAAWQRTRVADEPVTCGRVLVSMHAQMHLTSHSGWAQLSQKGC